MTSKLLIIALFAFIAVFVLFPVGKFVLVNPVRFASQLSNGVNVGQVLAQDSNATTTDENGDEEEDENGEEEEEDEDENGEDEDEVDDVDDIDVNNLPASRGTFKLLGRVTAVDKEGETLAVNGVSVDASEAKIRRGKARELSGLKVDDRVVVSGSLEDGKLIAKKIVVRGFAKAKGLTDEVREKLRKEINERLQEVMEKIREIREIMKGKWGIDI